VKDRGRWQGMMIIARLNWPFYVGAALVLFGSAWLYNEASARGLKVLCGIAMAGSLHFLVGSLAVSHLIYDRSDLYRWNWLQRALRGLEGRRFIYCHSGFDEASLSLREKLGDADWTLLDHFDRSRMTEASIRRARKMFPPVQGTISAAHSQWPVASESADVIFGLLAIHELRSERERIAWFTEAKRCLRSGGRIVIVEHVRDLANFVAFGPGFLHFHSPRSWRCCWEKAGLSALDEFKVTPWLRVFVIGKP